MYSFVFLSAAKAFDRLKCKRGLLEIAEWLLLISTISPIECSDLYIDIWFTTPTRQFCLVSTHFRRVRVGGVNIGDATKLSCLVELAVWTQLQTRQDSFVSSVSAVWTSHYKTSHKTHFNWSYAVRLSLGSCSIIVLSIKLKSVVEFISGA